MVALVLLVSFGYAAVFFTAESKARATVIMCALVVVPFPLHVVAVVKSWCAQCVQSEVVH